MKRRVHYYVSRKNVIPWLAVLLSVCAAAGYIANVTCGKGAGVSGATIWLRCVLPVAAALYFAWQVAFHGHERLYRVAAAWWMLTASFVYGVLAAGLDWYWCVAAIAALVVIAAVFCRIMSGKSRHDWILILLLGLPLAALMWSNGEALHEGFAWQTYLAFLPDGLFLVAFLLIVLVMKTRPEGGTYYPTWGDRTDGRRVRTLAPMSVVASYIMPDRNGASNMFTGSVEITDIERYIRRKRQEGFDDFGVVEIFLAAYVRCVAKYPALNRFLSGQKVYSRDDDIQFCMVVKKEMTTDSPDTVIKLHLKPSDTVDDVYRKFHAAVGEAHKSNELDSSFDGVAKLLGMIPGVLLKFAIWLIKLLDYFGLVPRFLLEVSPFHGSIFFTSMGSLGIPSIYHHLYDFGNLPVFCAFGCKRRANELDRQGNPVERKYVDFSFVLDERTVDGFYYATAFKYFRKLLWHPEQLELPPQEVARDIP